MDTVVCGSRILHGALPLSEKVRVIYFWGNFVNGLAIVTKVMLFERF